MDGNIEGDIDVLGKMIFLGEYLGKNKIQIIDSFSSTKQLFEALLMLFTYGMKQKYGVNGKVNLKTISIEDFIDFRKRFGSIGIYPYYYEYHISQVKAIKGHPISEEELKDWEQTKENFSTYLPKEYIKDYTTLTSNNINDYYFGLKIDNSVYFINFTVY
jgi:hypothetical protein